MTQNPTSAANKKISNYIMTIVVIVLVLSIVSIILAVIVCLKRWSNQASDLTAGFLAVIGVIAVTMSMFTLYQSRRQAAEMKIEVPKVMTTIECKKCWNQNHAGIPTRRLCL